MAQPGIRQPFYLNGHPFDYDPVSFLATPPFGETVRRVRDGALLDHTHRALVTDPNVSSRFRFEIEWEDLSENDVDTWLDCVAIRGPFDFCPWLQWKEAFTFLAGESLAGNFQRASAKNEIPEALAVGTPASDYDVVFKVDGTVSAAFAVSAAVSGRTPWATTGAATGPAVVLGYYAPLFRVRIVDQTLALRSAQQGGRLVLEEY